MSATPASDIAYRMLRLEQQLDSYQRLHEAELEQIRRALAELKEQILALVPENERATKTDQPPAD
jgi:molecular chaperone GrpE (heat shock protein)